VSPIPTNHPLRAWFAGLVEQSFQTNIGLADPSVLDYLVDLLADFLHVEKINLLGDGSGRSVEDVAEMLTEASLPAVVSDVERRRLIHRHIGDFTLFWTGLYPENLRRIKRRHKRDEIIAYSRKGKESYEIASQLSDDSTRPPARLLHTLSEQFEYCVYGLGLVRREWERSCAATLPSAKQLWC
jgi:hypothetical protein